MGGGFPLKSTCFLVRAANRDHAGPLLGFPLKSTNELSDQVFSSLEGVPFNISNPKRTRCRCFFPLSARKVQLFVGLPILREFTLGTMLRSKGCDDVIGNHLNNG